MKAELPETNRSDIEDTAEAISTLDEFLAERAATISSALHKVAGAAPTAYVELDELCNQLAAEADLIQAPELIFARVLTALIVHDWERAAFEALLSLSLDQEHILANEARAIAQALPVPSMVGAAAWHILGHGACDEDLRRSIGTKHLLSLKFPTTTTDDDDRDATIPKEQLQ